MTPERRASCLTRRALRSALIGAAIVGTSACGARAHAVSPLRVCADPNNLPFSNERQEGFENQLASMIARDRGTTVEYTWFRQARGFVRNTLDAGRCDVVMGVPAHYEMTLTTRPYYRSTYVVLARRGEHPGLASLDDERLRTLKIGVQLVGDDFASSPPALALSTRGLTRNVVGYSVLGDYSKPNPPARIVDAVAARDVDVALVWGPLAGYFARKSTVPLQVTPLARGGDGPTRPFVFDIAMGVRRGDRERQQALDAFLASHAAAIDHLLTDYGIPLVPPSGGAS
jgi:mxaJ protein